jgi:2-hydroxychromene-2-carboxylate isomerase
MVGSFSVRHAWSKRCTSGTKRHFRGDRASLRRDHASLLRGVLRSLAVEPVEFFFDYLSPYAYLAWPRIRELCERRGASLRVTPILLAGLLNRWGQLGPAEVLPKGLFVFKDCARKAAVQGIPFRSPRFHPFKPLTALRVSQRVVAGDDQARVIDALFRGGWGEGADLGSDEAIVELLERAGVDGKALVLRVTDPSVKAELRDSTERAVEQGVFGVPTVLVGSELFWGNDQIDFIDRRLSGADPIDSLDLVMLAPQGSSAQRRRPE